jgi:hypothetical protein
MLLADIGGCERTPCEASHAMSGEYRPVGEARMRDSCVVGLKCDVEEDE